MGALDALYGDGSEEEWASRVADLADRVEMTIVDLKDSVRVITEFYDKDDNRFGYVRARCFPREVTWERFNRTGGPAGLYLEFVKALDPQYFRDRGVDQFKAIPGDGSTPVLKKGGFEGDERGLVLDLTEHNRMDEVCGRDSQ